MAGEANGQSENGGTRRKFHVAVMMKPELAEPQGQALERLLEGNGLASVTHIRVGRMVELTVEAEDVATARSIVEDITPRALANPLIETFAIREDGDSGTLD